MNMLKTEQGGFMLINCFSAILKRPLSISIMALVIISTIAPLELWAADSSAGGQPGTHALMTEQELAVRNTSKKRLYPGGKDEEPLKVQVQPPVVTRKMNPAAEAAAMEPPSLEPAND